MGVYSDHFAFTSAPPSEGELAEHLRRQIGDRRGVEHYTVDGRSVELRCLFDPVTRPYALAFLARRGGVLVDQRSREPIPVVLPAYVDRPWRGHPWWRRLRIRFAYVLRLSRGE
jgi:hypothetical protein